MKGHAEFPALEKRIDEHAGAIVAADAAAAESFVTPGGSPSHDEFIAKVRKGAIKSYVKLARGRVGQQHMSKIRFITDGEPLLLVSRWREENGTWRIADSEDLSGKRSPWSDIEVPKALRSFNSASRAN